MLGIFLLVILASWIWTYAYLLVEATAHGLPVPVLSIEMANPWHQPRPLMQLLIVASVGGLAAWLERVVGPLAGLATTALGLLAFPASLALLAVDGEPASAIWPPSLWRVARGLGLHYLAVLVLASAYLALIVGLARVLPGLVCQALAQLGLFSVATALGGSLHARRHALGLDVWHSPERDTALTTRVADGVRDRVADEIYGLLRAGRPTAAWDRAQHWLGGQPDAGVALRWLRDRALVWADHAWTERLDTALVVALLANGKRGEALAEVGACWRRDDRCGPWTPAEHAALLRAAREMGHDAQIERLERDQADLNG